MPIISILGGISSRAMGRSGSGLQPAIFTIGATTYNLGDGDTYNITDQTLRTATMQNDGQMRVKMWGASGGGGEYQSGGGGYSAGVITFNSGTVFTIQTGGGGDVGGKGVGGTPGGGNSDGFSLRGSGGGYSGIFINSVAHANAVLIAGAGGGSGNGSGGGSSFFGWGGHGGGVNAGASPGTSIIEGAEGTTPGYQVTPCSGAGNGSALQGGSALTGGGGGWYGGGGSGDCGSYANGGSGGNGYINTTYVSDGTTLSGSEESPGNPNDPDRNGAGSGQTTNIAGVAGRVYIYWE
jgi:hypothetical protein